MTVPVDHRRSRLAAAAAVAYIATIVAANYLTARYGLVWVAPGLVATAGTYAAGLALGARDVLQDLAGRVAVIAAIFTGAVLSAFLANPALAFASGVAFLLAESADMAVYTPLRRRGWARAVITSNIVGAVLDTFVFLALAGFPITVASVAGQLVGKLVWATLVPVLIIGAVRRALPRPTVNPARA